MKLKSLIRALLLGAILLAAMSGRAKAQINFTGTNGGLWSVGANWSTGAVPTTGDNAVLGENSTASNVTMNFTYTGSGLASLILNSTDTAGTFFLNQSSGAMIVSGSEVISNTVAGDEYDQTGGSNTAGSIYIGNGAGSAYTAVDNTYALSGTGTLTVGNLVVGNYGNGSFSQTGGSVMADALTIGNEPIPAGDPVSSYTLSTSGTLTLPAMGQFVVGQVGSGIFNQSAGVVSGPAADLNVGSLGGANGTYNLSGGSLTMFDETVGFNTVNPAMSLIAQTGGTNTISSGGTLEIGFGSETTGAYTLSNGGALALDPGAAIIVASIGTGTFTQSAGTVAGSAATLDVGAYFRSIGTYNLAGGMLTMQFENIGYTNTATDTALFAQTGGTNTITSALNIAIGADGSTGAYTLSNGGSIALDPGASIVVGAAGVGTFTQSAGTVTGSSGSLYVGQSGTASDGTYTLSGGALAMAGEYIGGVDNLANTALLAQTGGTNTITSGGSLEIASGTGAYGAYTLANGGALTLDSGASVDVGEFGAGSLVQSGGVVAGSNGQLFVGLYAGSSGAYSLGAGMVSMLNEEVGAGGTGAFIQMGGTNTVTNGLEVSGPGSSYSLSGSGSLTVASEQIAASGSGAGFLQSGGTNTISNTLTVGVPTTTSSNGSYNLSGGALNALQEVIGGAGPVPGTFTQTGGVNTIASGGSLAIEYGSYDLNGGTLVAPSSAGGFTTLLGGALSMQGNGVENGYFQNFGTFQYFSGVFNGTLENDGTASINSALVVGGSVFNNRTLTVAIGASLGAAGGGTVVNNGALTLDGGALTGAGAIDNESSLSGFGTIGGSGGFFNDALLTQGAGTLVLANSGTNRNDGTIALAAGFQFQISSGVTLFNAGTLSLSGGVVSGSGVLTNTASGTVSGPGTITAAFVNSGVVVPNAGTLNIPAAWTNGGVVELNGPASNIVGGTITNAGTIQGDGTVGSAVTNSGGSIEAFGGTLVLGGTLTNPATGAIYAGAGSKVLVSTGLAANAGVVNLTGGTFDNSGYPLTNTGEISGWGAFRTGGLTNSGTMTFSGGQTTVNGNVTNNSHLTVAQNAAFFSGNLTDNVGSVLNLTNATLTVSGTFVDNGTDISDPSTQSFADLVIGASGSLVGGAGDVYNVSGDVVSTSTQAAGFNISAARLTLQGAGTHTFTWAGANLGATSAGYTNNFAIGVFEIQSGGAVDIIDGNGAGALGIYVQTLELDGGLSQIGSITGNGADIFYDASEAGNAYLDDGSYALEDGGYLMPIQPVPEPGAAGLLLFGAGLLAPRLRRKR